MNILNLLANDGYIAVNKEIAKLLGLHEAIIIGELASEYIYWEKKGELDGKGYFYSTIENVERNTTLGEKAQRSAINTLVKAGILKIKRQGLPAKRYVKICEEELIEFLTNKTLQKGGTVQDGITALDSDKRQINNNNQTTNKKKNKEFIIPTYEEVQAYAEQRGKGYLATQFYEYWTYLKWVDKQGKPVKSWERRFDTWIRKNEEYTSRNNYKSNKPVVDGSRYNIV